MPEMKAGYIATAARFSSAPCRIRPRWFVVSSLERSRPSPSGHWAGNQMEFGFFVDHFTFIAGLLFAAVHGPGDVLALRLGLIRPAGRSTAAHA